MWDAVGSKWNLKSFVGCCQPFVAEAASIWKLLDHWLSYKTMTMLWRFGNFPVDLNLLIFVDFVLGFKAGLLQGKASGQSDVWVDLQWVLTRLPEDKNLLMILVFSRAKVQTQ